MSNAGSDGQKPGLPKVKKLIPLDSVEKGGSFHWHKVDLGHSVIPFEPLAATLDNDGDPIVIGHDTEYGADLYMCLLYGDPPPPLYRCLGAVNGGDIYLVFVGSRRHIQTKRVDPEEEQP